MIRPIRSEEISLLKEFTYQALYVAEGESAFDRSILERPEIAKYYLDLDSETDIALVAECQDAVVGAVWGRFWPDEKNGGYGYLSPDYIEVTLSVLPSYRGEGRGRALMESFLTEASSRHIKGISLSVSPGNPAMELYGSLGFTVLEKRETDILMKLELE